MKGNCELCRKYGETERHHVFEGIGRRQASETYDCVIRVCRGCHNAIHSHPKEHEWLKQEMQRVVMQREGWTMQEFIDHFGKNYIEEE